jgi:hypothetical protein
LEFALLPLKIAISPVILLIAGFDMISFGFYVGLNALTPVWLQNPTTEGGYGFSVTQNAACMKPQKLESLVTNITFSYLCSLDWPFSSLVLWSIFQRLYPSSPGCSEQWGLDP